MSLFIKLNKLISFKKGKRKMENNNEVLREKLIKEYNDNTQKFLFWLDGVQAFAPEPISNLCDFIHTTVEKDPNQIDVLLVLGSLLNNLETCNNTVKILKSITEHIEVLYPDNDLNVRIEDLDVLQAIRTGIEHWLTVINNPVFTNKTHSYIKPPYFIDPPSITETIAVNDEIKTAITKNKK